MIYGHLRDFTEGSTVHPRKRVFAQTLCTVKIPTGKGLEQVGIAETIFTRCFRTWVQAEFALSVTVNHD